MIAYKNLIDFNEVNKKDKVIETTEESKDLIEAKKQLIKESGLTGFFTSVKSPEPEGIVLDYDVEDTKKRISKTALL